MEGSSLIESRPRASMPTPVLEIQRGGDQIKSRLHLSSKIAFKFASELHLHSRLHLQVESKCNLRKMQTPHVLFRCKRARCSLECI